VYRIDTDRPFVFLRPAMPDDRPAAAGTDPFLAAIDSRLAALKQLRESYLAARAAGAIGPHTESAADWLAPAAEAARLPRRQPATAAGPEAEPGGPQRRGAIATAAETYLASAPRACSAPEIAAALEGQGLTSAGASFAATITSAMHRLRQRGRVVRRPDGWAVVGSPAASLPVRERRASKRGGSRPRRRARRPRPLAASVDPTPDRREDGLAWRIESLLKSHGDPVAARFVANETGEPLNVVGLTLGRMIQQERVEKDAEGRFHVVMRPQGAPVGSGLD
jgi:hypothetical protein